MHELPVLSVCVYIFSCVLHALHTCTCYMYMCMCVCYKVVVLLKLQTCFISTHSIQQYSLLCSVCCVINCAFVSPLIMIRKCQSKHQQRLSVRFQYKHVSLSIPPQIQSHHRPLQWPVQDGRNSQQSEICQRVTIWGIPSPSPRPHPSTRQSRCCYVQYRDATRNMVHSHPSDLGTGVGSLQVQPEERTSRKSSR